MRIPLRAGKVIKFKNISKFFLKKKIQIWRIIARTLLCLMFLKGLLATPPAADCMIEPKKKAKHKKEGGRSNYLWRERIKTNAILHTREEERGCECERSENENELWKWVWKCEGESCEM